MEQNDGLEKESVLIRDFNADELRQIAALHKNYINKGFLSSLGDDFLTIIYKSISEKGILIAFKKEDKIVGYVSGVERFSAVLKHFVLNNLIKAGFFLLPKLVSFEVVKKIGDILLYPLKSKKDQPNIPQAELLSIVVDKDFQGKGISENLYKALKEDFMNIGIKEFKIIVGDELIGAQKFYLKMGAKKEQQINLHQNSISWIFIQQL
jgi:ribosomal protein S18 acetylase RimI-like enzyme